MNFLNQSKIYISSLELIRIAPLCVASATSNLDKVGLCPIIKAELAFGPVSFHFMSFSKVLNFWKALLQKSVRQVSRGSWLNLQAGKSNKRRAWHKDLRVFKFQIRLGDVRMLVFSPVSFQLNVWLSQEKTARDRNNNLNGAFFIYASTPRASINSLSSSLLMSSCSPLS